MPNEYSVEIHNFLSEKIAQIKHKSSENNTQQEYLQGQIAELHWIRDHLKDHIDLKNFTYY